MMCGTDENHPFKQVGCATKLHTRFYSAENPAFKKWRATAAGCQNSGKKRLLDVCVRFSAISGMICLSFQGRFDILLEKRPSGIAELRYIMVYGKSQVQGYFYGNTQRKTRQQTGKTKENAQAELIKNSPTPKSPPLDNIDIQESRPSWCPIGEILMDYGQGQSAQKEVFGAVGDSYCSAGARNVAYLFSR